MAGSYSLDDYDPNAPVVEDQVQGADDAIPD